VYFYICTAIHNKIIKAIEIVLPFKDLHDTLKDMEYFSTNIFDTEGYYDK